MSKKLSFEDALRQKMNELPLPDENESWQKMKELLDEKKKRRALVFLMNYKTLTVAILLLLLCLWLVISPERIKRQTSAIDANYKTSEKQITHQNKTKETTANNDFAKNKIAIQQDSSTHILSSAQKHNSKETGLSQEAVVLNKNKQPNSGLRKQSVFKINKSFTAKSNENSLAKKSEVNKDIAYAQNANNSVTLQGSDNKQQDKIINSNSLETAVSIDSNSKAPALNNVDSSSKTLVVKDSLQQEIKNENVAKTKIIIKRHNAYFIDAGIGLQQQIPVSGQKLNSYNYNGNKTILTDYIPSFYIRLAKEKQWFLQGEFSYASPRLIKEFAYYQNTKADYNHGSTTKNVYHLQKTWYTEIPVSFNVYAHSSWSVGAGVVYSMLHGTVANEETTINNAQSGKQTTTTQLLPIKGFTDSFLYKTQTGFLLQTGYEKNRWSFALRYVQDLQPFLTYTLPDGTIKDKKNSSLAIMIRYRLFQSAKFTLGK